MRFFVILVLVMVAGLAWLTLAHAFALTVARFLFYAILIASVLSLLGGWGRKGKPQ